MRVIGNDSNPWESKGTSHATTPGNKALFMDLKNNDGQEPCNKALFSVGCHFGSTLRFRRS